MWQCDEHPTASTLSTASTIKHAPACAHCEGEMRCVRHVSFVDCPGHSVLMTRMLSGASVMDAAVVVIAANLPCPQPQTFEHVAAIQALGISNVFVAQNKVDLVDEASARQNLEQIRTFLKGTLIEDAPVVPLSAQRGWNLSFLLHALLLLREPRRCLSAPARVTVIRSFDVNKCGCVPDDLCGGVAGGIVVQGVVRVGDQLDIVPGLVIRREDQRLVHRTLSTTVLSIFSDQTELDHALPGGLYGRCLCMCLHTHTHTHTHTHPHTPTHTPTHTLCVCVCMWQCVAVCGSQSVWQYVYAMYAMCEYHVCIVYCVCRYVDAPMCVCLHDDFTPLECTRL
jgi:translation initiation factor 2 gamma subunit (eIF-2gamma)